MQHLIALQFLSLILFSVTVVIGCEKKKPKDKSSSAKKGQSPSKPPDNPPSSHIYVDASCQPKSVIMTKQVTVTSKVKSKSTNPNVKPKNTEPPAPIEPQKDMAKELDKLREEANKGDEKKEEEDFGYENCGYVSADQLKKAKAAQSKGTSKAQTIKKPLPTPKAGLLSKSSINQNRPMKA